MPPGQANKRRSTTSVSEANPIEVPAHMSIAPSPVDASAGLSPVDASPSLQTADIDKCFILYMAENPMKWEGRKILLIHTGGLLGLFDKTDQMMPLVGNWCKMDIHESIPQMDGAGKMF